MKEPSGGRILCELGQLAHLLDVDVKMRCDLRILKTSPVIGNRNTMARPLGHEPTEPKQTHQKCSNIALVNTSEKS